MDLPVGGMDQLASTAVDIYKSIASSRREHPPNMCFIIEVSSSLQPANSTTRDNVGLETRFGQVRSSRPD